MSGAAAAIIYTALVGIVATIFEAGDLFRAGKLSPVELTRKCLERIERLNPKLNAFITVTAESAVAEARAAESELAKGNDRGPLHGIPIALKDIIDTAGVRTTAASAVDADRIPKKDARVVTLLRQAGAVIVGKTNLHEFAYGGSGLISHYGPVRNPWDVTRITGGSSSGSAAAVAAGMCLAAIGTDTAGSIRLPAAFCGIVGHKPTYGLVSARNVVPLSWSYDHVGPMTRTAADAATVLSAIAGYDEIDLASREYHPAALRELATLRVGVARQGFFDQCEAGVARQVESAVGVLGRLVREVRDVVVPMSTDRTVHVAEAFLYHEPMPERRAQLYHPETLRRIRNGAAVTASEYIRAFRELQATRRFAAKLMGDCDVVVSPTVPMLPPTFAELEANPAELRARELLMLRNTRPFNVLGTPAVTIPCAVVDGLPVGLQISGRPGEDLLVLAVAEALEQELPPRILPTL